LVKRFVTEPGSDAVARLVLGAAPVATARLAAAEAHAAFARRWRKGVSVCPPTCAFVGVSIVSGSRMGESI